MCLKYDTLAVSKKKMTLWQADVFAYFCEITVSNGAVSPNTQHNTIKLMTPDYQKKLMTPYVSRHNFQTQPHQNKPKTPDCKHYMNAQLMVSRSR